MKNSIKILLPVYNTRDQLYHNLASLENQDCRNFTVEIHDNNSTDGSSELISEFIKNTNIITNYIKHNKNIGGAKNFLSLINKVDDDYFMFLDSEDKISKSYVSSALNIINNVNPDVIIPIFYEWGLNNEKRIINGPFEIANTQKNLRLPSISAMCNTSGLGYFFYGIYKGNKFKFLYQKILNRAITNPSKHLSEDIAFSYVIALVADQIEIAYNSELMHFSKCIVDENRLLLNSYGIKDILTVTPEEVYFEALEIAEKSNLIDKSIIKQIKQIIKVKSKLKKMQLSLAMTL
jgi:glycosyltransferase involved in cell wall biosynthesis